MERGVPSENFWIIVGVHGAYTGTWHAKKDAIAQHTAALDRTWAYCRAKGDKAVKATITWTE